MKAVDLLELFRLETNDLATPYLWSDDEIYAFMDDAQKMFCRLEGGISDSTSPITQIPFAAGQEWVDLSPTILKLRYIALLSNFRSVEILNIEDVQFKERRLDMDYGFQEWIKFDSTPGAVRSIVVGMEAHKARLIRVPAQDDELRLVVYRMPLVDVTAATKDLDLEIDALHHRHLISWMKYLAHMKQDAEAYDRGKAIEFRAVFEDYCDRSKHDRELREHKHRTVGYGGY